MGGRPGTGGKRVARGGVTVRPGAKRTVVSGGPSAAAAGSDIEARIAAGKAAAARRRAAEKGDAKKAAPTSAGSEITVKIKRRPVAKK